MAKKKTKAKETETTLGRLSKAGEEALTRLVEELGKNERVTDAVARAMSAKGRLDDGAKRAVGGVGLAAAEELKELRTHIEKLEKRLAKLEADTKPTTRSRTTKPRTSSTRARKPPAPKPSESSSGETPAA
jgi:hypothetical protein